MHPGLIVFHAQAWNPKPKDIACNVAGTGSHRSARMACAQRLPLCTFVSFLVAAFLRVLCISLCELCDRSFSLSDLRKMACSQRLPLCTFVSFVVAAFLCVLCISLCELRDRSFSLSEICEKWPALRDFLCVPSCPSWLPLFSASSAFHSANSAIKAFRFRSAEICVPV